MRKNALPLGPFLALLTLALPALAQEQVAPEALRLRTLIQKNCTSCHSGGGKQVAKYGNFLDAGTLRRYVNQAAPAQSVLYRKVATGAMPEPDFGDFLDDAERRKFLDAILTWSKAGTPDFSPSREIQLVPKFVPSITREAFMVAVIDADIASHRSKNFRYLYFPERFDGSQPSSARLKMEALAKLVNSLSWNRELHIPGKVDAAGNIYRIDIAALNWTPAAWDQLAKHEPYQQGFLAVGPTHASLRSQLNTPFPILRADWFITNAAQPPAYHDFLNLPHTDRELENLLGVHVDKNISSGKAARAGFVNSGVSRNNRMIERHDSKYGAYWKSYDFKNNIARKNLFSFPLGPAAAFPQLPKGQAFEHDGGEIIFNLPNGLQAYLLIDGQGRRIDRGPLEVVADPERSDHTVVNGISCMRCHSAGIISKGDQIEPHFTRIGKSPNAVFDAKARTAIASLYRQSQLGKMEEDSARYLNSLRMLRISDERADPIHKIASGYERDLSEADIAAEIDSIPLDRSSATLAALEALASQAKLGGVKRDAFEAAFAPLIQPGAAAPHQAAPQNAVAEGQIYRACGAPAEITGTSIYRDYISDFQDDDYNLAISEIMIEESRRRCYSLGQIQRAFRVVLETQPHHRDPFNVFRDILRASTSESDLLERAERSRKEAYEKEREYYRRLEKSQEEQREINRQKYLIELEDYNRRRR